MWPRSSRTSLTSTSYWQEPARAASRPPRRFRPQGLCVAPCEGRMYRQGQARALYEFAARCRRRLPGHQAQGGQFELQGKARQSLRPPHSGAVIAESDAADRDRSPPHPRRQRLPQPQPCAEIPRSDQRQVRRVIARSAAGWVAAPWSSRSLRTSRPSVQCLVQIRDQVVGILNPD